MTIEPVVLNSPFDAVDFETDVDPMPPAVNLHTAGAEKANGQTVVTFVSNESTDDA